MGQSDCYVSRKIAMRVEIEYLVIVNMGVHNCIANLNKGFLLRKMLLRVNPVHPKNSMNQDYRVNRVNQVMN